MWEGMGRLFSFIDRFAYQLWAIFLAIAWLMPSLPRGVYEPAKLVAVVIVLAAVLRVFMRYEPESSPAEGVAERQTDWPFIACNFASVASIFYFFWHSDLAGSSASLQFSVASIFVFKRKNSPSGSKA